MTPESAVPSILADASQRRGDEDRLHNARLANLKQQLLAPVNALVEIGEHLVKDAGDLARDSGEADHDRILGDLRKILESCRLLLGRVQRYMAMHQTEGQRDPLEDQKLRHDLRSPLNAVIGYSELLLEVAEDEQLLQKFEPELKKVRALGKQTLAQFEELVAVVLNPTEMPVAAGDAPEPALVLPPRAGGRSAGAVDKGTILVVDDNEVNRDLLRKRLTVDGHTVVEASDGREALDLVRQRPFDLVLLDVMMPDINGYEVLDQLKADPEHRHVPIIMISALNEIDSVVHCIERGAEDYLPKPFNPVLLRARVNACLEKKRLRDREVEYQRLIEREKQRADDLLHVILPGDIVRELKETNAVKPRRLENVAVLFADIVGFTPYCGLHPAEHVVGQLQKLVVAWEEIALRHGVEKIKTIGDSFMAACGMLKQVTNPVLSCLEFAVQMRIAVQELTPQWNVRIGIHTGAVVAGVLGQRQYLFDLWGDTVNTAARMESHGRPGAITLSGEAWQHVAHCCRGESLGQLPIKGKGEMEIIRFDALELIQIVPGTEAGPLVLEAHAQLLGTRLD